MPVTVNLNNEGSNARVELMELKKYIANEN